MGKWLALLEDEILQAPSSGTDKTHTTGVLQVLSVTHERVFEKSRPLEAAANAPELAPTAAGLTCADCLHRLPYGTCAEPVAAGLLTAAEGFGIVWPPEDYGATCASFGGKPIQAIERPYRLSREQADAAHAEPWNDAVIARFQARQARLMRLGYGEQDADDLAERLHLRDLEADDRVSCSECSHYRPGRCGNHRAADLRSADVAREFAALMQRCRGFKP